MGTARSSEGYGLQQAATCDFPAPGKAAPVPGPLGSDGSSSNDEGTEGDSRLSGMPEVAVGSGSPALSSPGKRGRCEASADSSARHSSALQDSSAVLDSPSKRSRNQGSPAAGAAGPSGLTAAPEGAEAPSPSVVDLCTPESAHTPEASCRADTRAAGVEAR